MTALNNINLQFNAGEIIGIIGANASGKTSLLKAIAGLFYFEGKIFVNGYDVHNSRELNMGNLGLFFNIHIRTYQRLTPFENLQYYASLKMLDVKKTNEQILWLFRKFKIFEYRNTQMRYLSSGICQRVALMFSLIGNSSWLLLDEPTINLDYNSQEEIIDFLKSSCEKKLVDGIVITSHDYDFISRVCSHIIVLHQGRVVFNDTVENFYKNIKNNQSIILTIKGAVENFEIQYPLKRRGDVFELVLPMSDLKNLLALLTKINEMNIELIGVNTITTQSEMQFFQTTG